MTRLMNEQLDEYNVVLDGVIQWNVFEADDVRGKIWINDNSPLGYSVKTGKVELHKKTAPQDNTVTMSLKPTTSIEEMNKYLEEWRKAGII